MLLVLILSSGHRVTHSIAPLKYGFLTRARLAGSMTFMLRPYRHNPSVVTRISAGDLQQIAQELRVEMPGSD
jgi:hypothetical protein